jgi:hypothetical protein
MSQPATVARDTADAPPEVTLSRRGLPTASAEVMGAAIVSGAALAHAPEGVAGRAPGARGAAGRARGAGANPDRVARPAHR